MHLVVDNQPPVVAAEEGKVRVFVLSWLGPVGVLVAAYGVWRQLSPEDQQRVLERAKSLLQKARLAWRPEQSPPSASSS